MKLSQQPDAACSRCGCKVGPEQRNLLAKQAGGRAASGNRSCSPAGWCSTTKANLADAQQLSWRTMPTPHFQQSGKAIRRCHHDARPVLHQRDLIVADQPGATGPGTQPQ
jgi:hypothetical protein